MFDDIEITTIDRIALGSTKKGKNSRPLSRAITNKEKHIIENTVYPVIVELKCQFLNALPNTVSIRERRCMMHSLNKAGDAVLNLDPLVFDCVE
jgi:hypothetical protein